ncbi:MAG TPA: ABC transporter permease, partial [Longimicrobiales bacterium]|nr:ABC transporter permease [Longimicrobiales bacterium]
MSLGSQIWERLRALVFRAREEREAADELSFHLELETAKNVAAGMTPAEAGRAARLAFGGADQVREDVRSQRGFVWLDHLLRDVRHSWRTVLRMPGFALVVVLSLGIGIGVNTAIFSWLQTVRFRPIPGVRNASEFHVVEPVSTEGAHPDVSWPEYGDLKARLRSFPDLIAFTVMPLEVGEPGRNERTYGQLVSGNFFSALELRPEHGRFFGSNETVRGSAARVAVISYGFWQKHFGGSLDAVGRTLRVNDRDLTVLGVAPREFQGSLLGLDFDLWVPVTVAPELFARSFDLDDRARRDYTVMGRLRPGMALADAQAEVSVALRDLARLYPVTNRGLDATIIPFWQALRGPQRFFLGALLLLQ